MNADVSDSLDGRYFGALPVSAIMGTACPGELLVENWTNLVFVNAVADHGAGAARVTG
jgi:hypothetical protein